MYKLSASSHDGPSSIAAPSNHHVWLPWEGKLLELGVAELDYTSNNWAEKLAARLPCKKLKDVREYYVDLVTQIESIELGSFDAMLRKGRSIPQLAVLLIPPTPSKEKDDHDQIALPSVEEIMKRQQKVMEDELPPYILQGVTKLSLQNNNNNNLTRYSSNSINYPQVVPPQSKKGKYWSEEEHRLFLMGMKANGRGCWKDISRNFVKTRTSTQVASHAQKYFKRLQKTNNTKRRPSIHDIRSINVPLLLGAQERTRSIYDMVDLIRPPINNNQNINQSADHSQAPGKLIRIATTNAAQGGASTFYQQGTGSSTSYDQGAGVSIFYQGVRPSTALQGDAGQGARASIPYRGSNGSSSSAASCYDFISTWS